MGPKILWERNDGCLCPRRGLLQPAVLKYLVSEPDARPRTTVQAKKRARCSGLWEREGKELVYVRYEQFFAFWVAKEARRTRSRCGSEQVILCVRVTIIVLD